MHLIRLDVFLHFVRFQFQCCSSAENFPHLLLVFRLHVCVCFQKDIHSVVRYDFLTLTLVRVRLSLQQEIFVIIRLNGVIVLVLGSFVAKSCRRRHVT